MKEYKYILSIETGKYASSSTNTRRLTWVIENMLHNRQKYLLFSGWNWPKMTDSVKYEKEHMKIFVVVGIISPFSQIQIEKRTHLAVVGIILPGTPKAIRTRISCGQAVLGDVIWKQNWFSRWFTISSYPHILISSYPHILISSYPHILIVSGVVIPSKYGLWASVWFYSKTPQGGPESSTLLARESITFIIIIICRVIFIFIITFSSHEVS